MNTSNNNQNYKSIETVYEQTKYEVINSVNSIASKNQMPSFLIAIMLKEICLETSNASLGMTIAQNELISKEEYSEFLKFKNNNNTGVGSE